MDRKRFRLKEGGAAVLPVVRETGSGMAGGGLEQKRFSLQKVSKVSCGLDAEKTIVHNSLSKVSSFSRGDSENKHPGGLKHTAASGYSIIKGRTAADEHSPAEKDISLSDQEREDIAAGLTPAMAGRASEARVDTLEWLLGLETLTQEQAELVACFRRMDAALISARGNKPYLDSLGIPRFPPDCEPKYRHWEGGQPLLDTLLELGASNRAIDVRVTMERSPNDWRRWQEIKAKRRK